MNHQSWKAYVHSTFSRWLSRASLSLTLGFPSLTAESHLNAEFESLLPLSVDLTILRPLCCAFIDSLFSIVSFSQYVCQSLFSLTCVLPKTSMLTKVCSLSTSAKHRSSWCSKRSMLSCKISKFSLLMNVVCNRLFFMEMKANLTVSPFRKMMVLCFFQHTRVNLWGSQKIHSISRLPEYQVLAIQVRLFPQVSRGFSNLCLNYR